MLEGFYDHPGNLHQDEYYRCEDFASRSMITHINTYKERNQLDKDKLWSDVVHGKCGEFVTHKFLSDRFGILTEPPDLKVYENKYKSFEHDLVHPNYNFHVKTQNSISSKMFSRSWMFNLRDHTVFRTYDKEKDYAVFLEIDGDYFVIKCIFKIDTLHKYYLFSEPKLDRLKGEKATVYYDQLVETLDTDIDSDVDLEFSGSAAYYGWNSKRIDAKGNNVVYEISSPKTTKVVNIKRLRKICPHDQEVQDRWHWIELSNGAHNKSDFLYNKDCNFFAFETFDSFFIIDRKKLTKFIEKKVDFNTISELPEKAKYKLYQREFSLDLVTLIATKDIKPLVWQEWSKIKNESQMNFGFS